MSWNTFVTSITMAVVAVMLIMAAILFAGCSTKSDLDERMLEIDCTQCEVKYKRIRDESFIKIKKDF